VSAVGLAACGGSDKTSSGGGASASASTANTPFNKIFGPGGKDAGSGVTLKDGMLLAVTGAGSFYGQTMSQAAKLAAQEIEASGGPKFDIKIGDHKSGDIPAGVSATRQLLTQDGVSTLQTSFGPVSEAIIPLIQQKKVLTFQGGGTSPGQIGKDYLWNNRMVFGDAGAPGSVAWIAKAYPKAKRLAIIGTPENGVPAQKKIVPELWPKLSGGTIVASESHDVGTTDFGPLIARVRAAKPDVIWTASYGDDVGNLVKAFDRAGMGNIPIVGIEYTPQACKVAGASYNNFIVAGDSFDSHSENPFTKLFVEAFTKAYGREPELYSANYYEQMFIMWELVRRTIKAGGDPAKGEDLQKQLIANPEFNSVYGGAAGQVGKIRIDPKTHAVIKPQSVARITYSPNGCTLKTVAEIKPLEPGMNPAETLVSMNEGK
jgi:branched-chain amino acid transport system substrate-binding protein